MSSLTHPRGRLPARVYWVRRGLVLLVALVLIWALVSLLGGTGSDPSKPDKAAVVAAKPSEAPLQGPVAVKTLAPRAGTQTQTPAPRSLAAPDGECAPSEVGVTPVLSKVFAGKPVTIQLRLTSTRAACTFKASSESLVVRISSGKDAVWSSQHCPKAIAVSDVVVRSSQPTDVPVTWSGQRSDDQGCKVSNPWAKPGFYHVVAAALGSEPTDVQFELQTPPRPVITRTVTPKPEPKTKAKSKSSSTVSPTPSPSGAVEPDQTSR